MPDKETIQQMSGFGSRNGEENVPIQDPVFGITVEYIDSGGGYKYFSGLQLPKPMFLDKGYEALNLFKFLTESLCKRFHPDGSEEILDPMTGVWDKR